MRVLVTGGAGFIGSHVVDGLLRRGHAVRVLDLLAPPIHPSPTRPAYLPADVDLRPGDVRRKEAWEDALAGVEAVIHLAAYQDYLPDFSRFADTNDVGTALLYEVAVERRLPLRRVVVASSQAVYGEGLYTCPAHGRQYPRPRDLERLRRGQWEIPCPVGGEGMTPGWTDERIVGPTSPYGVSKYAQELYALALGRLYGIPTVALRYSIVQGPRQSPFNAYSGVLRIFASRLLGGLPPIIYEDGAQVRDYLAVEDAVAATLLVLELDPCPHEVLNVGGDRAVTVREYAALIGAVVGVEAEPLLPGEFRHGDVRHIRSEVSRLKALGWEARTPLRTVVERYVEWLRALPGAADRSEQALAHMRALGVVRRVL